MKLVFFGTSEYAAALLDSLGSGRHEVALVVTQPDARRNRGQKLSFTPVKEKALELGLSIYQPGDVNSEEARKVLEDAGADLFVVVSFGSLLKQELLDLLPRRPVNVHPSLLPLYRGAAPIQRAIMDGRKETGVTIMEMEARLDAGPILLQKALPLPDDWDYGRLSVELAGLGGTLLDEVLDQIEDGTAVAVPQDEALHTYAKKIAKGEKYLSFDDSALTVRNHIRGLAPKVTPLVLFRGSLLGILRTTAAGSGEDLPGIPGEVLKIDKEKGILVKCKEGSLWLESLKPEGKKAMHFKDFLNGSRLAAGEVFGSKKES